MIAMEQEMRQREQGQDLLTAGGAEADAIDVLSAGLGKEGGVETKAAL